MSDTTTRTITAVGEPNIAFIKYWGNRAHDLRIPANGSISMNLAGLETRTSVHFAPNLPADTLTLNDRAAPQAALSRVSTVLDRVRAMAGIHASAAVVSTNNFPTGAGIASSASAFAALALAASKAAGLDLDEPALSRLARTGSGSACRSIPGGFVEWLAGTTDEDSFAFSIAPAGHWDLVDCVAVVSSVHKATGSTEGHAAADTSPLQPARVADASRRIEICRRAILDRDFPAFAEIVEQDSHLMHAVMMTGSPSLIYWQPATLAVLHAVRLWRSEGLSASCTIDAGPNVHVICTAEDAGVVETRLRSLPGVEDVLTAGPGGAARLV